MEWQELIGKKIVAFRGLKWKNKTNFSYILFDDQESFIRLNEQDRYDYHDCNLSAREIELSKDAKLWQKMFNKEDNFNEPDNLGSYPF